MVIDWIRLSIDSTLFIKESGSDIIVAQVYVDEITFVSTNQEMMGVVTFFFDLYIKQLSKSVFFSQSKYVANMLKKFSYTYCKATKTAMTFTLKISVDLSSIDVNLTIYIGLIESLLCLTTNRPNIMFATNMCTCFHAIPQESHLLAIKCIFSYLKHTPNLWMWYPRNYEFNLIGYTNSNYVRYSLDRKSTSMGWKLLGNRLINWCSKKTSSLACLTTKVEYVLFGTCCAQILLIQNQLQDYSFKFTQTPICCDNTNCILILR